jgi:hypothetical protein
MILVPMDNTMRSVISISCEPGNNAARNTYPGMNRTNGSTRSNRMNDWLITGKYSPGSERRAQRRIIFMSPGISERKPKGNDRFSCSVWGGDIVINYYGRRYYCFSSPVNPPGSDFVFILSLIKRHILGNVIMNINIKGKM